MGGEDVKIKMELSVEKQNLQLIKMLDFEEHLKKNVKIRKDGKTIASGQSLTVGPSISGSSLYCSTTGLNYYTGDLFSSTGNLILVLDIRVIDTETNCSESRFPGTYATLAGKFSDANVNPANPPTDLLTDVVLSVGKNKIYCHKLVLGMTSTFFERMFLSDMKESRSPEIELKGVDIDTIKSVISFMYKDKIDDHKITVEVLAAADMYQVRRLKDICCTRLAKTINCANVSKIWNSAYLHDAKDLAHAALIYMLKKWKRLTKQDDIRELCSEYPKLVLTISTLMAEGQNDDSE